MRYRAAVALGSNVGDRLATLRSAIGAVGALGRIDAISSLYESDPVGGPRQGSYLNAVLVLETDLEPEGLLSALQAIESDHGRERSQRWGPRTLDLDLVAVEQQAEPVVSATEELTLPHPRAAQRRFVLEPLVEVWPQGRVTADRTARQSLPGVLGQEVENLGKRWVEPRRGYARFLVGVQVAAFAGYAWVVAATGHRPDLSAASTWIAVLVALVGAAVSVWALASLGSRAGPSPEPRPGTTLVATGPYRWVRHPIYSGLVVAAVGLAGAAGSVWGLVAAAGIAAFLWFKAGYEERRCRIALPGYPQYQRRVPGRMIPRAKGPG